jgi:uncharacterized membrane protein required for colicin V production
MGIIDISIIFLLLMFGIVGAKHGFFKQTVFLVGTVLVFVLSYSFKNPIANFLSYNFPFFKFASPIEGLTSLNILVYQLIGFLLVFFVLMFILGLLIKFSSLIEKILNFTIILGIPSKILGFIVGLIEGYVIIFVILFVLNQPMFNFNCLDDSKLIKPIVNSSPVLSNIVGDTNDCVIEIYDLIVDYNDVKDPESFNKDAIKIMLDNKIVNQDYIDILNEKGKINY